MSAPVYVGTLPCGCYKFASPKPRKAPKGGKVTKMTAAEFDRALSRLRTSCERCEPFDDMEGDERMFGYDGEALR